MSPLVLATAALVVFAQTAAQLSPFARIGYAEEVLHKNSLNSYDYSRNPGPVVPTRRNSKSMSFIDYFFPSSRNPKVSSTFDRKENASVSEAPSSSVSAEDKVETVTVADFNPTAQDSTLPITIDEGRATGSTKKGTTTAGKRKSSSSRIPSSTTPKSKVTQKYSSNSASSSTKTTQRATTTKPLTKNTTLKQGSTATTQSQKTTHKHYTIYPSVVMTKTNPPTSVVKSKVTESTTEKISSQIMQKVTLAELAKVSEGYTETSVAETVTEANGREGELELRDRPQTHHVKINEETKKETVPLPAGSTSVLAKPTKYHYYPHNQHIYLLPECAIQQVCNAVYVRLNYTQPLCACPARHRDPCSASLNADDLHTTQLTTDSKKKYAHKAVTLVKTCEATSEMRECRAPRDWSLLALQNVRTGKSHYLVICRCPEEYILEGPMSHDQPTYASVPGIRVYGMMCVQPPQNQYSSQSYSNASPRPSTSSYKGGYSQPSFNQESSYTRYPGYIGPGVYYNRMARMARDTRSKATVQLPAIPWDKVRELAQTADWEN